VGVQTDYSNSVLMKEGIYVTVCFLCLTLESNEWVWYGVIRHFLIQNCEHKC